MSTRGTSVTNTLAIIEIVAECGVGITAKEIAQRLGLPPATAYRLLNSLVADEYLIRTADLRGFGLGARLRGLATALNTPTVSREARRCLAEFRASTRFAVHLIGFGASTVQVINQDPDHPVPAERELTRCLHASAAGKLLLSTRSDWPALVPAPLRLTLGTRVTHPALAADIAAIRSTGHARAVDELLPGLTCFAYPIHNEAGIPEAALCLAGSTTGLAAMTTFGESAHKCAAQLESLLF
ncbi:IclR family transcriptional regulator [Nocardia sp. NPDC059764]|uniref:IclR family transcriptional regulator n=1 Tax=Nocardia sp. NPDC059764 TaxID=3346939 RepID=UPI0036614762